MNNIQKIIYKKQNLNIPSEWKVEKNEFYDISLTDDIPEMDKLSYLFLENILWFKYQDYTLDLGWYGSENIKDKNSGFMLVLFKGDNWNNCKLLELTRSKSKDFIATEINTLTKLVLENFYCDKIGYEIKENGINKNYIGEHSQFSVRNKIDIKTK